MVQFKINLAEFSKEGMAQKGLYANDGDDMKAVFK
jgi:hypothetical protein